MLLLADSPPKTKVAPVIEELHGKSISDPYRWLEDQNSPETRAWVGEQMKYTQAELSKFPGREKIHARMAALMRVDTMSAPSERSGRFFYSARRGTQRQAVWYMRKGLDGKEIVLIDPNTLSADGTISAAPMAFSEDGTLMAYGLRKGGEDELELHLRSIDTMQDLTDILPRARYSGTAILNDKSGFYYATFTKDGPRMRFHKMGTKPSADQELFGKAYGASDYIGIQKSDDEAHILISAGNAAGGDKQDLWMLERKTGTIKPIVQGIRAHFNAELGGDDIFISSDYKATNSKIFRATIAAPEMAHWKEVVPEGKFPIQGFTLAGGRLIVETLENVIPKARILDVDGKLIRELTPPSIGNMGGPFGRWKSNSAYYSFTTYGRPTTIYRYDVATAKQSVWFEPKIPFDANSVEIKQVWYTSKDGTKVPMFLAYKKGLKLDGNNPTLLTAYGGFNVPVLPSANPLLTGFIDMGGVVAEANLRGGSEFGEKWHQDGMLDKKQNVFDDFIAAGEYLIAQKYTSKKKLAIEGGSNGGLLVGAAMTQRPDLFQAVICAVPLLDMIRYQRFLVARFWVPEYGSSEDAKQFEYLYKYSPYHHVERGVNYPATMIVSGDSDTRVDPSHARKFAALLQASTKGPRPALLHYDTKSGHSGGLPIDRQIDNVSDELTFLAWQLGMQ
ncbi:MAG: prolyl oligopeptidase family serine peptidase [Bryobacteraceae bacterium]